MEIVDNPLLHREEWRRQTLKQGVNTTDAAQLKLIKSQDWLYISVRPVDNQVQVLSSGLEWKIS